MGPVQAIGALYLSLDTFIECMLRGEGTPKRDPIYGDSIENRESCENRDTILRSLEFELQEANDMLPQKLPPFSKLIVR